MMISGQAPLAEMTDYQSRLKSVTGGEGSYNMEFAHYEPAPAAIQKQLMSTFEHPEED
jgi:elongation factor G